MLKRFEYKVVNASRNVAEWYRVRRDIVTYYSLRIASVAFVVLLLLSLIEEPDVIYKANIIYVALLFFILIPVSMCVNSLEYYFFAKLTGLKSVGVQTSLVVTTISSAANILPVPGGAVVRIGALKNNGVPIKHGSYLTLL